MIIDAHVHLYPAELNREPVAWSQAQAEPHWATLCTRRRRDGRAVQSFPDVAELLRAMDAAGVARAVLLGWYWQRAETCTWQNQFYAECVRAHPDRLSAMATLQPGAGEAAALAELRRARDAGLIGLGELSPHAQGYDVADPALAAVLAQAAEWRWPVNLHVTDQAAGRYPGKVETPRRDFLWLARTFPQVNFILAHWGGRIPLFEEEAEVLLNVFYDTAASPLLYEASIWRQFLDVVPVERVLFGSDYPLHLYPKLGDAPELGRLLAEARSQGVDPAQLSAATRRLLHL